MLLTPKQKLVWNLHRKQGIPQVEIARTLGLRPESVCRLLARAEDRVKSLMEQCGADACALLDFQAVMN